MNYWGFRREEKENRVETLFKEIIAENFPNMGKDLDIQVHGAHKSQNKLNLKRSFSRHIIIKLSKIKD